MTKRTLLLFILILCACDSRSPKKSGNLFFDSRLFFDLESEVARSPCSVQGEIPSWISGVLLRNGPAKFHVGDRQVSYFDGLAMLHAFEFSPDQVLYSNRFIRSEQYYIMMDEKSVNFSGFAQDPCPKVFKNQTSRFIPKDMRNIPNADVSIQEYADQMVALTEIPIPVHFDPQTLNTLGAFHYGDDLPASHWESAHPQHDLFAKESINYFVNFGEKSSYVIWKMADRQATREVIAEIPVQFPAYMHSFAMTEHYIVLAEFPFVVNPIDLTSGKKPFIFNYKWKPEQGTNFHVVDRSTGELLTTLKGDPFFAFHHANAFDDEGKIFMDIVTYENPDIIAAIANPKTKQSEGDKFQTTKLERFTIDMDEQSLSREIIFPKMVELPRLSDRHVGRKYRYCYAHHPISLSEQAGLYKIDVAAKTGKSWVENGCVPGEPIFAPRPGGEGEDDGIVLSLVLDYLNHRSFLLILDAADFTEIARAETPHAIPIGIHGAWKIDKIKK